MNRGIFKYYAGNSIVMNHREDPMHQYEKILYAFNVIIPKIHDATQTKSIKYKQYQILPNEFGQLSSHRQTLHASSP